MRHPGQQREGPRRSSSRSVTIGLTEGLVSPSGHADDEVLQQAKATEEKIISHQALRHGYDWMRLLEENNPEDEELG